MDQLSTIIPQPSVSQGIVEGVKWAVAVVGVGVAYPAAKAVWTVATTWAGFISRMDRIEYILTGDKSQNGLRGDVKLARAEVQDAKDRIVKQNTDLHLALGNMGLRVEQIDARVTVIDERTAKAPRRKTTGRRKGDA